METRMHRADITAPTTPEQYRAALERQERVIADLRAKVRSNEEGCRKALLTCASLGKSVADMRSRLESAQSVPDDGFNGSNSHLASSILSFLRMDEKGAVSGERIGGHAKELLSASASRLSAHSLSEITKEG